MSAKKPTTKLQRQFRAYMKASGYRSQSEAARALGLHRSHISMILLGERRPRWPLALRLSKATGIEVEAFMEVR